ncbi:peptidoglycan DD-metalloendopeptidase family protein [uncultured Roseibium sp.]|uniref:peptidoglycan DD-metalloendopeptidase family protein n=1 Tax=uncultured Roseibium sp. TaxID=1936171 RepID=UPI00262E29DD|nr:peptidoglycan DD-metalloendopeptidase family protein [uncultured Roseibium sp.]
MRTLRRDLLGKAATVSLIAVTIAGCSSATERFGESPYYTANTQNQRDILSGGQSQPTYQDIVNGPGGSVAGLPQSSSQPVTTASISKKPSAIQSAPLSAPAKTYATAKPTQLKSAPVATLPAPEVSRPAQIAATSQAKSWKGWTSAGGTRVQVRQGDDLNSVARRYGVPIQALAAVNGIEDPKNVRPGQSIIIPTYVYAENNASTSVTEGETGRVKLPAVSRNDATVTGAVPTSAGSMPRPAKQPTFAEISRGESGNDGVIRVSALPKRKPAGSERVLTTASISTQVPAPPRQPNEQSNVAAAPSGSAPVPSLPQPALTREQAPSEPIKTPAVVASVQEEVDASTETFRWPVRGRIISDFGAKPGGGKNEGVNLAVPEGTPVKAADDGTVIYSGNELKGYGNLILVRHSEGWVTAYAHNSELKVKRGDKIRRGDVVALAGATGSVNQPQVHFELRQGNKPVDPLKHLPQR